MVIDTVEPIMNQYAMSFIDKIKFEELDLGDTVMIDKRFS
jgi:Ca2+-dependent lipid-binding protein